LSWLLPVELDAEGRSIVAVHYDKAIEPTAPYQHYGVEDARITKVGDTYYMTTCGVSAERHCTAMYTLANGLDYTLEGVVLDHQNKDMILFEGKVGGQVHGAHPPARRDLFRLSRGGPWLSAGRRSTSRSRPMGSTGSRSITPSCARARAHFVDEDRRRQPADPDPEGWLMIYHGVETRAKVGIYRSFWACSTRTSRGRSCGSRMRCR
jgi:hypothetical protein